MWRVCKADPPDVRRPGPVDPATVPKAAPVVPPVAASIAAGRGCAEAGSLLAPRAKAEEMPSSSRSANRRRSSTTPSSRRRRRSSLDPIASRSRFCRHTARCASSSSRIGSGSNRLPRRLPGRRCRSARRRSKRRRCRCAAAAGGAAAQPRPADLKTTAMADSAVQAMLDVFPAEIENIEEIE